MEGSWRIVIPLRLSDAKTRLSTQTAPRRRALVIAMARDVISAAQRCSLVGETVLVADQEGLDAAAAAGARAILDPGLGLNAAIRAGAADSPGPVATLLADVPCATPELISLALSACTGPPAIVSDAEGIGTTVLAALDVRSLDPRFGTRSRAAHIAAGAQEISDPLPGGLAGLRRDVDSEVDLWDARRIGLGAFTVSALDNA